ncbi:MAG: OB-fold domain-containing protein [Rhizobacter sp.]|nr:OB-fold domain-containing protein [Rhizobacter sp.]
MNENHLPYAKPLPTLNDENRPFWTAAREGRLSMQTCTDCGHTRFPISHVCPRCLSYAFDWRTLSGRGHIYSYIVFHQVYHAGFKEDVPYNVALVQLEEGPRMYSNVVGVPNNVPKVGDAVQAVFEPVTPEITLPRFKLR